jgi:hypothetical protein
MNSQIVCFSIMTLTKQSKLTKGKANMEGRTHQKANLFGKYVLKLYPKHIKWTNEVY